MKIGQRIRQVRENNSLKTAAFAKIIGISQGSLSDIENGKTNPRASTLQNLVSSMNVDPLWLLTGEGREMIENRLALKSAIAKQIGQIADELPLGAQKDILKYVQKEKLLHELKERNK